MKIIHKDGSVTVCGEEEQLTVLRHTAAHILAQAVKRLYPYARFAFGPATEQGFYYDVDLGETKLNEADLPAIEEEMRRIVRENYPIKPFVLPQQDALALMQERGEDYKCEHIASLAEESFSFFRQGEFIDLCRGPHLTYTHALKVFRLTGVSGAYWKNDASRPMLTRISGTAFFEQSDMDDYFGQLEEAKRRDHRRIGQEMELFLFDDAGAGFPFFLPGGVTLKNMLIEYWRSLHTEHGYREIATPQILNSELWKQSGHWAHYQDKMYMTEIDGEVHCIKPMNCPGGIIVYNSRQHSYREFPIRLAELGLVHRNEL
ncbi:MAG: threonine--tRNA ligase, partial [Clostridia bacterium]|nr:threonine--tRNA ligase [Clostridia bacterium]